MPEETLLAFDYGTRKIGVALGNTITRQARPLAVLKPATRQARFQAIEQLLQAWRPARVVVGLPLTLDGQEQYASLQSRRFVHQLHGHAEAAVQLVDERGSSMEAQNLLGAGEDDDAMAAAVILQRYFDAQPA